MDQPGGFKERPRLKHGRVIAVGNLKGGTGKSTVTVNLASALAARGMQTAILDTDPQSTATRWAELGKLPAETYAAPLDSLDEIGTWIADAEELRRQHDLLVVDLPSVVVPALGAAFVLADLIVIPSGTSLPDLDGTQRVLQYVAMAQRERAKHPPQVLLVPTRVADLRSDARGILARHLGLPPENVADALPHHVDFQEAYAWGEWVGSFRPGGLAHREIETLASDVAGRLAKATPAPLWLGKTARRLRFDLPEEEDVAATVTDNLTDYEFDLPQRSWWRRLFGT